MTDFEKEYKKIVHDYLVKEYDTPEQQGENIKKCSLLKDVNIQYGNLHFFKNQITFNES